MMILQGVGHPISQLGVCYTNEPKKGGYTMPAPALGLTTSLRDDLVGENTLMLGCIPTQGKPTSCENPLLASLDLFLPISRAPLTSIWAQVGPQPAPAPRLGGRARGQEISWDTARPWAGHGTGGPDQVSSRAGQPVCTRVQSTTVGRQQSLGGPRLRACPCPQGRLSTALHRWPLIADSTGGRPTKHTNSASVGHLSLCGS